MNLYRAYGVTCYSQHNSITKFRSVKLVKCTRLNSVYISNMMRNKIKLLFNHKLYV